MDSNVKIRVSLLRHHRDRHIRAARRYQQALRALAAQEAAGEWVSQSTRYDYRKALVIAVTKARGNNRSILMWRRIYK